MRLFGGPQVDEVTLRAEARRSLGEGPVALPDRDALARLTADRGVDFATAVLYESLLAGPDRQFIEAIDRREVPAALPAETARVLVVPTLFYREHPEIGGDGALIVEIARRLGLRADRVGVESLGSVERNAAIIAETVAGAGEDVWVVTLSKGSLDFKHALLSGRGEEWGRVRHWINISGVVFGSAAVDDRIRPAWRRWGLAAYVRCRGGHGPAVEQMARSSRYGSAALRLPDSLEVINVVGLPLVSHLSASVRRSHRRIEGHGPSDGFVAFWDAVAPGPAYPVWGADHYLRVPALSGLVYRIFAELAARAASRRPLGAVGKAL
jgi:hypothetical protein